MGFCLKIKGGEMGEGLRICSCGERQEILPGLKKLKKVYLIE